MDILHLVDRLEELFNQSRAIPLTHQVIVDEDRMLDLIDQMRVSIPEEVKKAQQLLAQKERVLAQSQEEATRTLSLAREKSEQLVERDVIVQAANVRAEQIIAKARKEGSNVKKDADRYVFDTLSRLHYELDRIMSQVQNGIVVVEKDIAEQEALTRSQAPPPVQRVAPPQSVPPATKKEEQQEDTQEETE